MSDAPAVADTTMPVDETTLASEPKPEPAVAEAKPAEGGVIATSGVAEVPKEEDVKMDEAPAAESTTEAPATNGKPEGDTVKDDAEAAPTTDATTEAPATNGTPAAKKTSNGKRKSGAGVPEHKKKTPAKGKKKAPELRLNVSAGEMYMVAMRGYQPWPVIICDEEMLPESLLGKRPVSAMRIDGTYREDFLEGGKNAKDRRYPIMFLGTNEFAWQVNTELLEFDLEDVKKDVEAGNQKGKNKALWEAYQIAAEGHDLAHFKEVLTAHEQAMAVDAEQREQKELEKKAKAEKAANKDVEMADADDGTAASGKKAKGAKKRKKTDESDGENEKPAKTPKTKLKLTTKTPASASASKPKKDSKAKKKTTQQGSDAAASPQVEEAPMTEEERLQKREKQVLYLRHRLQKGFLSRDQAPKDDDMASMSDYLKQLEAHENLESEVIKKTKVHKVLRAITKLNSIPKEEEYAFKQRSNDLLAKWDVSSSAEAAAATASAEPATNGAKADDEDKKASPAKEETPVETKEDDKMEDKTEEKKEDASAEVKPAAEDVAMTDAPSDAPKDTPVVDADAAVSADAAAKTETEAETKVETEA